MRKIFSIFVAFLLTVSIFVINVSSVSAATRVKGYVTKKGTYVAPHFKSSPNKTKIDNFSTKGNYNPYTGKTGTVNPYKITVKKYK